MSEEILARQLARTALGLRGARDDDAEVLLAILPVVASCAFTVALAAHVLQPADGALLPVELRRRERATAGDARLHEVEVRLTVNKPL